MKTELKRKFYVTPFTRMSLVEMESGICAGSIDPENGQGSSNDSHKVNTDFSGGFENDGWD